MSLGGSLQIGRSGLLANQAALEVAGNNLANVATRGYHRQEIVLEPARPSQVQRGQFIGRGVQIQEIRRNVDDALESRLRGGVADESAASARHTILSGLEAIENELSDVDLSSKLSQYFNAWSDLANQPADNSLRSLLAQRGGDMASHIQTLRGEMDSLREQADGRIAQDVTAANDLLARIEGLNIQIARAEAGAGGAHTLRDQRDQMLQDLSQYVDISVVEQPTGVVDVYIGSTPVVLDARSRGIELQRRTVGGEQVTEIVVSADKSQLAPASGSLGAAIAARNGDIGDALDALDQFANQLIFQVNKLHAQGQAISGSTGVTGASRVSDAAAALDDAAAGLDFTPVHGSFQVHVTQKSTGQRVTSTISVDLDGIGADTSLNTLAAAIDGIANIGAAVTSDGRLRLASDQADFEISFSDDSSGALAALGINTFFTGSGAGDIAVNDTVRADPGRIAAASGHVPGDNRAALAIAGLRSQGIPALNGRSLTDLWNAHVEDFGIRLGQTTQSLDSARVVKESLSAQQQAASGVNTDEEAINLLQYQRAYQGSAKFLTVVDEMLQTLLGLL